MTIAEPTENIPSGDNRLLGDDVKMREIGRLERFLGPDNYRILKGLEDPRLADRFPPGLYLCNGRHLRTVDHRASPAQ